MNEVDALEWSSHLAPLCACLGATTGPVLEMGMGHFSTPILHAYCGAAQRRLVSVDDNPEWEEGMNHNVICLPYAEAIVALSATRWAVCLMDHGPVRRAEDFKALLPVTDYIVLHDFWKDNQQIIEPLIGDANFHVCKKYEAPTLVCSLNRTIPSSLLAL